MNGLVPGHRFLDQRVRAEALARRSLSARPLLAIAPPVNRLNVVRVIVSPRSTHTAWVDVVGYYIGIVGERPFAEGA